ncbi:MAG: homocysteine biosynthesis protein [Actinobacteria bacterium]|nr:homocysteine biosynthesis protein [Actinomycetota bacterium]MCG2819785.1 homocysteine biosynthesis protein [Actinomycetes bacterium]MBU4219289.1 homocysteine biosynthesis protein [Actinomycetota bacterium]MBU4359573.1 homocysteine biosynthesis protein [Actinomycetota bacterium]MBU4390863.1 homocysteine biosynthesis protein [Actinomycetota bacterium]
MAKTYEEINQRIRKGEAVVLTAEEMTELVKSEGVKSAAGKVDVVTTGTFGPMCSSGAFLNFGHSDPPIRMSKAWLNDVPVCADIAAVDVFVGATAVSEGEGARYGGAHVIQDLIDGKWIKLRATGPGTDCYPLKEIETWVNKDTINQAFLFNPRNAYQNYACATNSSQSALYTYMGVLLPAYGNATYCSAGQLSPLLNDPLYRTIGVGTRVFLGGAAGFVAWPGTQHKPSVERTEQGVPRGPAGTLALIGDLKEMDSRFIRAARFHRYGVSLYVGVGIPIPVLDEEMAAFTGVSDYDIETQVFDYSKPTRAREPVRSVSYAELRSGRITIGEKKVHTAPISSYKVARLIAETLKGWISEGRFQVSAPVGRLPLEGGLNVLDQREEGV